MIATARAEVAANNDRASTEKESRRGAKRELVFIVGAGRQSTRGTINEIKRVAPAVEVDAFLVITPHFYRPAITQEALIEHYQRVADESPAPIISTACRRVSKNSYRLAECGLWVLTRTNGSGKKIPYVEHISAPAC